ncbi:MAG TPA: penicillin-binding protein 2 [Ktedonobacteraceae bacterium]
MSAELRRARSRQMIIFLLGCGGMVILLGRLYYWQIWQSGPLTLLANSEHTQNQILSAPRGLIYDAQGHLLATNVVRDDVYITPLQFSSDFADNYPAELSTEVHALHQVLPSVSEDQLNQDFGLSLQAVRVAQQVDPGQSQRLRDLHLPDTFLEPQTWRIYPGGDLASQILGYTQGDKGIYGIEAKYNTLLAGKAGSFTAETDLSGNPLTVGASSEQDPVKGTDLTLTVDSFMQYFVQNALQNAIIQLEATSGTVIVLNAHSGAVVAMAGYPTFDPNHYSDFADQKGCVGSEDVYLNPALFCDYEPGSTMKSVTMAAALEQHVITPDTSINDPGYLNFSDGTPTVHNWDDESYGKETMTQVLQHSANVGAATVATWLGPDRFYPYLERFGFGQPTGLFDPEDPGGYRTNTSAGWTKSDLTRQAFGQSITASPLQMARVYQAIANGGAMMQPYILASTNDNGHIVTMKPQMLRRVISADTAKTLTSMLVSTAEYNDISLPNYSLAIKTGTATTQGLSTDQTEASVAGFLPASNPQFVILVKIDRPQKTIYGGTAAGPIWKAIAQQLVLHYSIPADQQVGTQ